MKAMDKMYYLVALVLQGIASLDAIRSKNSGYERLKQ